LQRYRLAGLIRNQIQANRASYGLNIIQKSTMSIVSNLIFLPKFLKKINKFFFKVLHAKNNNGEVKIGPYYAD
jgi:hypothetical protein